MRQTWLYAGTSEYQSTPAPCQRVEGKSCSVRTIRREAVAGPSETTRQALDLAARSPYNWERFFQTRRGFMWSRNHVRCLVCGTATVKHMARGLCQQCYQSRYREAHADRIAETKRTWNRRNGGTAYYRLRREAYHYASTREAALERDGYVCQQCGETADLVVHHLDGNGRSRRRHEDKNNELSNLVTLCKPCHVRVHVSGRWARHHDRCIACGTTDRRHNARGLCWRCYRQQHQGEDIVRSP